MSFFLLIAFARPPDESVYLKIVFLISQSKRMLSVLKRTVSTETILLNT